MKKHRRLRGKELKKHNRKILLLICGLFLLLGVGYSAFSTIININVSGVIARGNFYVSNTGSDESGNGSLENPYLTIQKAYAETQKESVIHIMNDISLSTPITMNQDKKITLTSYSTSNIIHSVIKTAALNDYLINLTNGSLTLEKITLDGNEIKETNSGIYNTAELNINEGATIQRFINTRNGGGIYNEGKLIMDGGTISNNYSGQGGGIWSTFYSELLFKNGIISNNTAFNGGGIFVFENTIVTMINGKIINNQVERYGGAIAFWKINETDNPIFNMLGGEISGNSAVNSGAVHLPVGTFNMSGGIVKNNTANKHGGIYTVDTGTFNYTSGIICENTPSNSYETHVTCPS